MIKCIFFLFLISQVAIAQKKKKTSVGPGGGSIELSPLELRATTNDFFYKFERTITESADSIIKLSTNPLIDKEALIWKMNAIPIANVAIYNSDAFLGYIDVSVFTYQMKLYFENGAGKNLFGDHQMIAIHALNILWEDLLNIGRNLVPDNDISEGTKIVTDFAQQHPLKSSYFVRQSTIPLMTKIQNVEKVTFKKIAVDMSQNLDEMRTQISSYMVMMPKQVHWETELLLNNTLTNPNLTNRFDSLADLTERMVAVMESTPEFIENQRIASFQDIRGEREAVLQAISQERALVLDEIKKERTIVLEELNKQLTFQREATFQDLTTLSHQSIELVSNKMENMIDKLYWRTVYMIAILLVLLFIGFIIFKKK
ncbi:hypothetical protein ACFS5J_12180 [Flavobacterium chuncheonense]|uniref:Uncharacterized protein n=1 Tax=Flavobacterium chuncheonense TaxID=2026653 RepID=A0ABW5YP71_9FLAO